MERVKTDNQQLQKEYKTKYPFCNGSILSWLEYRIDNYLTNNTERI